MHLCLLKEAIEASFLYYDDMNFDEELLAKYLDPFAPGMSRHITPIKFEVLTPDLSCFLFTTTGKDHADYYFVLVRYDYIANAAAARNIIQEWHGKVIEFLQPTGVPSSETHDLQNISQAYDDVYSGLLARVERPHGEGYWANNIIIRPGDDIKKKLSHLSKIQQAALEKGLANIVSQQAVISVYVKTDGRFDLFYW